MDSVYVVEVGEYSAYRVVGLFTTRAKAERAVALYGTEWNDQPSITTWPLNPNDRELSAGLMLYRVWMNCCGNNSWVDGPENNSVSHRGAETPPRFVAAGWDTGTRSYTAYGISMTVWAKDEKHALKIVNECRTRAIADGRLLHEGGSSKEDGCLVGHRR